MVHVIAIITTTPGMRDNVLTAFRENMPAVLAEQGCIEYQPVIDAQDAGKAQSPLGEDTFMVVEKWESMQHLTAHANSSHMAAYAKKVGHMVADRSIHILSNA